MEFLQELRGRYGDISLTGILNRCRKIFGKTESPPPPTYSPPVKPPKVNSLDAVASYGISQQSTPPPAVISVTKSKFSPVNIAGRRDWMEFRDTVSDLHELKNFFAGKQDSQSPQFLNLIETYKAYAEKKLATPNDFDESTSYLFVEKLAEVIRKRFYTILKACVAGLRGRGKESVSYYQAIDDRVKKYFAGIGLKSANVKPRENFRQWMEHFEPTVVPAPFEHLDNLISEIYLQPRYFEYYNEDGEIEKFWIDGECTVFKRQGVN